MPFKIWVFPVQPDIVVDLGTPEEQPGSSYSTAIGYIHTILTAPEDDYDVTSFALYQSDGTSYTGDLWTLEYGDTPTDSRIRMDTSEPWTLAVMLKARADVGDYDWEVTFSLRVCGEEGIVLEETAALFYFLYYEDGTPSSLAPSVRYEQIAHSEYSTWFSIDPDGDPCTVKEYYLAVSWSYDSATDEYSILPWDTSDDPRVTFEGTHGSQVITIDKTYSGADFTFLLVASTRGRRSIAREIRAVIC